MGLRGGRGKEERFSFFFLFIFIFLNVFLVGQCSGNEQINEYDSEFGQPEVIEMTMEEFNEKFNSTNTSREEQFRKVGMCWEKHIVQCIRECKNNNFEFDIQLEICVSYCQSDAMWNCTSLNLQNGGNTTFLFGYRWPIERFSLIIQPASALSSTFAFLFQLYFIYKYFSQTNKKEVGNNEYTDYWPLYLTLWAFVFLLASLYYSVDIRLNEYALFILLTTASLLSSFISFIRVFNINLWSTQLVFSTPFLGTLFFYLIYLVNEPFDIHFAYLIIEVISIIQVVFWSIWWILSSKLNYAKWILRAQILLIIFGYVRKFHNFPPYYNVIDVNSVYMLSFVCIMFATTKFAIGDSLFHQQSKEKKEN